MKNSLITTAILLALSSTAIYCQHFIGLSAFGNLPVGVLKDFYKPALGLEASYHSSDYYGKWLSEYSIGYTRFSPKDSVFALKLFNGKTDVTLTDFWMATLTIGAKRTFKDVEKMTPFIGISASVYYSAVEAHLKGPSIDSETSGGSGKFGLAPSVGLIFQVAGDFYFKAEGRFNFTISPFEDLNMIQGYNLGFIDNYVSLGGGVFYKF